MSIEYYLLILNNWRHLICWIIILFDDDNMVYYIIEYSIYFLQQYSQYITTYFNTLFQAIPFINFKFQIMK